MASGEPAPSRVRLDRLDVVDLLTATEYVQDQTAGSLVPLEFTFTKDVHVLWVHTEGGIARVTVDGTTDPTDTRGIWVEEDSTVPIPINIPAGTTIKAFCPTFQTRVTMWGARYGTSNNP